MKRWFRQLSVSKKIILAYVPVLLVTISLCFFAFSALLQTDTLREVCATRVSELQQISDKIEYIHQNMINISNVYLFDDDVRSFLAYPDDESNFNHSQRYNKAWNALTEQHSIFYNVSFSTTIYGFQEDAYLTDSPTGTKESDSARIKAYKSLIGDQYSKLLWVEPNAESGNGIALSAVRYILDARSGDFLGMILFDFEETVFSKTFQKSVSGNEVISLVNEAGQVISSSDSSQLGQNFKQTALFENMDGYSQGYFYLPDSSTLACFTKYNGLNLYILKTDSYDLVAQSFSAASKYLIFFVILIGLIFTLGTILLSHYISKPLRSLTKEVQNFHPQDAETSPPAAIQGDEIAYLHEECNKMIDRINTLIHEIIEEQSSKRKYEMKALQSQINPHFLYNTLHSMRFLNRTGERNKLDQTILALVRLLSKLFQKNAPPHTVGDELEMLRDYVLIQQTRYGNNFEVEYDCSESELDCAMEKLILQPIVENSIFHGLSSYEEGGLIRISVFSQNCRLHIRIWDNGVGLQQQAERDDAQLQVQHGIGLENVRKRLELLYKGNYCLNLSSNPEEGTTVELEIPRQMYDVDGNPQDSKGDSFNESNDRG